MAAIIDGSTYQKYFKLTADDASPAAYFLIPKDHCVFQSIDATHGSIFPAGDLSDIALNFATTGSTEDENGNALDTSDKVSQYLNDNK